MVLINPQGEYPRHIGDLLLAHPDWKDGDPLPNGWQKVEYADELPSRGQDEVIYEAEPTLVNGKLMQTFKVRPMTVEELERRDAPKTAKQKLMGLGLSEAEIEALTKGLVR